MVCKVPPANRFFTYEGARSALAARYAQVFGAHLPRGIYSLHSGENAILDALQMPLAAAVLINDLVLSLLLPPARAISATSNGQKTRRKQEELPDIIVSVHPIMQARDPSGRTHCLKGHGGRRSEIMREVGDDGGLAACCGARGGAPQGREGAVRVAPSRRDSDRLGPPWSPAGEGMPAALVPEGQGRGGDDGCSRKPPAVISTSLDLFPGFLNMIKWLFKYY